MLATLAFRLSGGAAAPLAKLAGTCVEIVFVGIRLCDRLVYAARHPDETSGHAAVSVFDSGIWERQLPQLAEPLAPPDHKAQLTV